MRPNVLLLVVDSLRADSVLGHHIATPNLDRLAASGASCTQCVCTASNTTPSFSSILTGCYPPRHSVRGLKGYRLAGEVPTLAGAFSKAGYGTHARVTGPLLEETGLLRDFDSVEYRDANRTRFGWRDDLADQIASFEEPWLLLLHTWEAHFHFAQEWEKRGYERSVAETDRYLGPFLAPLAKNTIVVLTGDHGENLADGSLEERLRRAAKWGRRRGTARWWPRLDERLSRMMGHGYGLDEQLIRVPLVLSGPSLAPRAIDQQVRHVDLLPTLAELCHVPVPADVQGRSLKPLLEGRPLDPLPAYMETSAVPATARLTLVDEQKLERRRVVGVRSEQWKYIKKGDDKHLLYRTEGLYPGDGTSRNDTAHNQFSSDHEIVREFEDYLTEIGTAGAREGGPPDVHQDSGMTQEQEAVVERRLQDLGYL